MINFSTPSKKDINKMFEKFSIFLSDKFSSLSSINLKKNFNLFIYDKRFVITCLIILISVFAHLSTPAFYKPEWVQQKVKKQLEEEFNIIFSLNKKVEYAMFPIPNFTFKKVKLYTPGDPKEFAIIENFKIFLSFEKFFDKDKMNIQSIKIKNSQFSVYHKQIDSFINFFDKKINSKKLIILDSKIFFKDKSDEIYSLINLKKSESFVDEKLKQNNLFVDGNIFNNNFNFTLKNNYLAKSMDFEISLPDLKKEIINKLNYSNKDKFGNLNLIGIGDNHSFNYSFNSNELKFKNNDITNKSYILNSKTNFSPFFSNLFIEFKDINLKKLISTNSLLYSSFSNETFLNENLNYKINIKSANIKNHRKLKDLDLIINFDQNKLNLNGSSLKFDKILNAEVLDSEYTNNIQKESLSSRILITVNDSDKLYSFFQTRKKYRKKIKNIFLDIEYNFRGNHLMVKDIIVDNNSPEEITSFLQDFNSSRKKLEKRIEIKNFFNEFIELF